MLINKNSGEPVYIQIINQYKKQIASNAIRAHDKLPSVRALSYELGINPNTLQKAFTYLEETGICYSLPGKGRFVTEDAFSIITSDSASHYAELDKIIEELAMCNSDIEDILARVRKTYSNAVDKMNSLKQERNPL